MGNVARLSIDRGIPGDLTGVPARAREIEQQGYDGCWTGEIAHDPFLPLLLAAEHTCRLQLGTSIAVAFARNPMLIANLGWDLNTFSQGRFILGLGTQVQPHIERRYGMPWSHPARRMREFVAAVHAIWAAWQHGTRLSFEGEFYTHTLMTPMFTPEPQPHGVPKIFIAAVGDLMTRTAGEVADGVIAHAFTTRRYLDEVTAPALQKGLDAAGRSRDDVELSCPVFVVTGENAEQFEASAAAHRKQLAFYGSTPAYHTVLELHGWGDLHVELHRLSRLGEWDTMTTLIDDDVLAAFAVVAELPDVADALVRRCAGAIDRVLPGFPVGMSETAIAMVLGDVRKSLAERES
ncbi:LLM class F420-dependent oxidoreductase [Mycolicibacterium frederiksbergense]|uniref:LLM class F420-dependent oxidoreductase n=1 Tax=Mycolicibacterium frederiksbergense TaxID=117567 RepID=UPI00265C0B11|nr:LLM class F420-dependent oxidoreductase [Mycolicibacterium frederiksbergense]MDO0977638.1 LLM class F420-dependent oxidoreductase [Mycolicibacterium frederiksbergense]